MAFAAAALLVLLGSVDGGRADQPVDSGAPAGLEPPAERVDAGTPVEPGPTAGDGQWAPRPRIIGQYDAGRPDDPFAEEYARPVGTERGTAPGQLRVIGSLGLAGLTPNGFFTLEAEAMPAEYIGVHLSASVAFTDRPPSPHLISVNVGASIHPLPFSPVEVSLGVEGGLAMVDVARRTRTLMAILTPQGRLAVWLSSGSFLQLTVLLSYGVYSGPGGVAQVLLNPGLALGVGYAL